MEFGKIIRIKFILKKKWNWSLIYDFCPFENLVIQWNNINIYIFLIWCSKKMIWFLITILFLNYIKEMGKEKIRKVSSKQFQAIHILKRVTLNFKIITKQSSCIVSVPICYSGFENCFSPESRSDSRIFWQHSVTSFLNIRFTFNVLV